MLGAQFRGITEVCCCRILSKLCWKTPRRNWESRSRKWRNRKLCSSRQSRFRDYITMKQKLTDSQSWSSRLSLNRGSHQKIKVRKIRKYVWSCRKWKMTWMIHLRYLPKISRSIRSKSTVRVCGQIIGLWAETLVRWALTLVPVSISMMRADAFKWHQLLRPSCVRFLTWMSLPKTPSPLSSDPKVRVYRT